MSMKALLAIFCPKHFMGKGKMQSFANQQYQTQYPKGISAISMGLSEERTDTPCIRNTTSHPNGMPANFPISGTPFRVQFYNRPISPGIVSLNLGLIAVMPPAYEFLHLDEPLLKRTQRMVSPTEDISKWEMSRN